MPGVAPIILSSLVIISAITYFLFNAIKSYIPSYTILTSSLIIFSAYIGLLKIASNYESIEDQHDMTKLPELRSTARSGLYFLLPITVLIWCLMIERFSPGLSAFWAVILTGTFIKFF